MEKTLEFPRGRQENGQARGIGTAHKVCGGHRRSAGVSVPGIDGSGRRDTSLRTDCVQHPEGDDVGDADDSDDGQ
jgi:hypothetical protein